ncbi:DNA polymerase IV [Gynuella sunshinyii]|uniref:DNA polymerase IV n=1 Tax=Gynuella sunshinyii YC6258 TaxID=1445510 RepID=A0A0C5W158_9GAMM|nr:DNA polymerase IV [Gynuella sunshinyii]AJQ96429.1 nucleotidyltransferase/DNA polymerase involved in DNA repair [Gynuella sunshinyii YC6258]
MIHQRKIIHFDCDCFYAAVEIRDRPELQGRPVAVGGTGRRGVLSTCNYEARHFGIRSAMPTAQALRLCPDLIVLPSRFDAYREASRQIHEVFKQYSELIEPLSLDEAYVDVTDTNHCQGSATLIARAVKAQVKQQVGITISAGVAPNKFLAKIASDWRKPDGLFVITPEQVADFVKDLPVDRIHGVGKVTSKRLYRQGIYTCGQLQKRGMKELLASYGSFGEHLYQMSQGVDEREVKVTRQRKSLSVERTYAEDIQGLSACLANMGALYLELTQRMSKINAGYFGKAFVKVRFADFTQTTVECTTCSFDADIFKVLCEQAWKRREKPVRLLGMGIRSRGGGDGQQLCLF